MIVLLGCLMSYRWIESPFIRLDKHFKSESRRKDSAPKPVAVANPVAMDAVLAGVVGLPLVELPA